MQCTLQFASHERQVFLNTLTSTRRESNIVFYYKKNLFFERKKVRIKNKKFFYSRIKSSERQLGPPAFLPDGIHFTKLLSWKSIFYKARPFLCKLKWCIIKVKWSSLLDKLFTSKVFLILIEGVAHDYDENNNNNNENFNPGNAHSGSRNFGYSRFFNLAPILLSNPES